MVNIEDLKFDEKGLILLRFPALQQFHQPIHGKGMAFRIFVNRIRETGIRPQMAGGTFLFHLYDKSVPVFLW